MNHLKNFLLKPLQQIPKWIPVVLIFLSAIGFADATYLTVEHYNNAIPPCAIGGCETVLTSSYSEIVGIPVSLLGALYYFIITLCLFVYFDSRKEIFLRIPVFLSICGLLASVYFVSLMIFILKALCLYCAVSATTSTLLFVISMVVVYKNHYGKV